MTQTTQKKNRYANNPLLKYPGNMIVQIFLGIIVTISALFWSAHQNYTSATHNNPAMIQMIDFLESQSQWKNWPTWCRHELFLLTADNSISSFREQLTLFSAGTLKQNLYLIIFTLGAVLIARLLGIHRHAIQQNQPWRIKQFIHEISFFAIWIVAVWAIYTLFATLSGAHYGLSYQELEEYGYTYAIASGLIYIILFDVWFYWMHRLMHQGWLYTLIHSTHHLSTKTGVLTQLQFSPLEIIGTLSFTHFILPWLLPLHRDVVEIAMLIISAKVYLAHSGYEIFPKAFTEKKSLNWLVTNTHHDLHHSSYRYNYAIFFTCWDKWFGTEHPKYHETHQQAVSR